MSIFLRVTENPLPLSNDNAPVIEISSAGDSKSYIWIRLRGNKGIWYSLVFREEQLAREKWRQVSLASYLLPLRVVAYLEEQGP